VTWGVWVSTLIVLIFLGGVVWRGEVEEEEELKGRLLWRSNAVEKKGRRK